MKPFKLIIIAVATFMLANFVFEALATLTEPLYAPFSINNALIYTRIIILIIVFLLARPYYTKKNLNNFTIYIFLPLASILLFIGVLSGITTQRNTNTVKTFNESRLYMDNNLKEASKCRKSTIEGSLRVSEIAQKYWSYENMEKVTNAEQAFEKIIEAKCNDKIAKYEDAYNKYIGTGKELKKADQSLLSKILGNQPEPLTRGLDPYNPSTASFREDEFVFTDKEVEQYIESAINT